MVETERGKGGFFMVPNSILRKNAREQLGNNIFSKTWLMVLVAYFAVMMIINIASSITCGIAAIIISGPMMFGFYRICVNVVKGKKNVDLEELFVGFKEGFLNAFLVYLMMSLFTLLWSLLCFIPGIVKSYSYAMAPYILQDDPTKDWNKCINESKEMMKGHRWQLFCLDLSFIGWEMLGFLCCCIGIVFVYPYIEVARANFYMALKAMNEPEPAPEAEFEAQSEPVDPFSDNGI